MQVNESAVNAQTTHHFVSGLPRAGSTLLMNLLAQNPRFHVTSTSGIYDMILDVRTVWDQLPPYRAEPDDEGKLRVLRSIYHNFHATVDRPVVFDKSRGWHGSIELAENIFQRKVKILVPVRDLRDVLSSLEKLWRKESRTSQIPSEREHQAEFATVRGRCELCMRPDQPLGMAYYTLGDAIQRGFRDRLHFVHFEQLTRHPEKTMRAVYAFLDEAYFTHNFEDVIQVTHEDDSVWGIKGLHDIRSQVRPVKSDFREVLGEEMASLYEGPYPWDGV